MLFAKLSINNLYSFSDFTVDFTFPRKTSNSTIAHEYLENANNFNIKRVCIISGGNATGKTSLAKLMCGFSNLIFKNTADDMFEVRDLDNDAEISAEVVFPDTNILLEVVVRIPAGTDFKVSNNYLILSRCIKINANDSVKLARSKLNNQSFKEGYSELKQMLRSSGNGGWCYVISNNKNESDFLPTFDFNPNIALKILKTFDPTVAKVELLRGDDGVVASYKIHFSNGDSSQVDLNNISEKGYISNPDRMSKGTFEAIAIVHFLCMLDGNSSSLVYFLDEVMAHVHSELEVSILNLIIEKLTYGSQFFYTTHNVDVLNMSLPIHSYLFLKRNESGFVVGVQAESKFNKNDRSLLNQVKNDIFQTHPSTELINELLYE